MASWEASTHIGIYSIEHKCMYIHFKVIAIFIYLLSDPVLSHANSQVKVYFITTVLHTSAKHRFYYKRSMTKGKPRRDLIPLIGTHDLPFNYAEVSGTMGSTTIIFTRGS